MILGCIDIGSNTTRLLVADAAGGRLTELRAERVFTCIRRSLDAAGCIPADKVAETVAVVEGQVRTARELGATAVAAVATAAIRDAPNRDELESGVEEVLGAPLRVLSGQEEARLSFMGATRTLPAALAGSIAVVDVGGGSTEIAVGPRDGTVEWWCSLAIGSAVVADRHLRADPPTTLELDAARADVAAAFDGLAAPRVDHAVAVGGTATSLLRVVGAALDHAALDHAVQELLSSPIGEVAERMALDRERVRLLPAGILLLQAVADRLGPLQIARGGVREGVILELLEGGASTT